MSALFENYDRLSKSASQGFILRAFLPWVFVIVVNIAIYELWIPDGRSVIDWLARLPEHLQIYTALAIVIAIAAVAGVSDGIVDLSVSPYRLTRLNWAKQSTSTNRTNSSKKSDPFICAFLTRIADAKGLHDAGIKPVTLLLAKIEEAETAVHRNAILVIGFGISIWLNTIWLARYQPNLWTSVWVIVSLQVMMAIAWAVAWLQMRKVTALDSLVGNLPDAAAPQGTASPSATPRETVS